MKLLSSARCYCTCFWQLSRRFRYAMRYSSSQARTSALAALSARVSAMASGCAGIRAWPKPLDEPKWRDGRSITSGCPFALSLNRTFHRSRTLHAMHSAAKVVVHPELLFGALRRGRSITSSSSSAACFRAGVTVHETQWPDSELAHWHVSPLGLNGVHTAFFRAGQVDQVRSGLEPQVRRSLRPSC
jgi:hypothetical protein